MTSPKHLRLDPALPLSFRPSGTLILGYPDIPESKALEIRHQPKLTSTWLRLLDGTRTETELNESAQAIGISPEFVHALMQKLVTAGHVRTTPDVSVAENLEGIELIGAGVLPARVFTLLQSYGLRVGWNPVSNQRIRLAEIELGRLSSDYLGRRWRDLGEIHKPPTVEVVFSEAFDPEIISNHTLTLPITWHHRRIAIGPYLNLANSHAAECLNLDHRAHEPDWNYLLTQILHQRHHLGLISNPWLEIAANQIVGLLTTMSAGITNELLTNQYELLPPNPLMRFRAVSNSECSCFKQAA